jgi:hypothetical protein
MLEYYAMRGILCREKKRTLVRAVSSLFLCLFQTGLQKNYNGLEEIVQEKNVSLFQTHCNQK